MKDETEALRAKLKTLVIAVMDYLTWQEIAEAQGRVDRDILSNEGGYRERLIESLKKVSET